MVVSRIPSHAARVIVQDRLTLGLELRKPWGVAAVQCSLGCVARYRGEHVLGQDAFGHDHLHGHIEALSLQLRFDSQ